MSATAVSQLGPLAKTLIGSWLVVWVGYFTLDATLAARDRLGINKRITPHSMSHGFATYLLEQGTDIRIVQMFLGHASLASTEIYTHMTVPMRDDLRLHPVGEANIRRDAFIHGRCLRLGRAARGGQGR